MAFNKYPWDVWLGQPRTVIKRGQDYKLSQSMMHQTVRNRASQRGISVSLDDLGDSIVIEVTGRTRGEVPDTNQISFASKHPNALAQDGQSEESTASSSTPDSA